MGKPEASNQEEIMSPETLNQEQAEMAIQKAFLQDLVALKISSQELEKMAAVKIINQDHIVRGAQEMFLLETKPVVI
ncbi:hypothetical protein D3C85_1156490 [compost metagenome]